MWFQRPPLSLNYSTTDPASGKILHGKSGSSDVIGFISRNHALPGLVCHLQEHVLLTSYRGVIRSRNRRFNFYLHQIFQNITIKFQITTLLQCKFARCRCAPVAFYRCTIQYDVTVALSVPRGYFKQTKDRLGHLISNCNFEKGTE